MQVGSDVHVQQATTLSATNIQILRNIVNGSHQRILAQNNLRAVAQVKTAQLTSHHGVLAILAAEKNISLVPFFGTSNPVVMEVTKLRHKKGQHKHRRNPNPDTTVPH